MRRALVAALAMLVAGSALAREPYRALEQRLTPEQMRETGLDGLSPAQLAALNRILAGERAAEPAPAALAPPDEVEGRVVGSFRGWQPGTVVTLDTGTRWRVVEGDLSLRAIDAPRAWVRRGLVGAHYLRVEGAPGTAKVKPAD